MRNLLKFKIAAALTLTLLIVPCSFAGEPRSEPFLPEIPQAWTQIVPEPTEYMGRNLSPTCIGLPGKNPEFSFCKGRHGQQSGGFFRRRRCLLGEYEYDLLSNLFS